MIAQSNSLTFRWTRESDLDEVLHLESEQENRSLILPWTHQQHRDACSDPDLAHLVIETRHEHRLVGFLLLAGRESVHRSIEFRRIVIAEKGKGYGKEALGLVKQIVFEQWNAHRLWLDVFDFNQRARHVYASQGFIEEGLLRECIFVGDKFASLVLMSLLAQDYFDGLTGAQRMDQNHEAAS